MRQPVPSTKLLMEVEHIIRDATEQGESPISLEEIKRRMAQKVPKHAQVRDIIDLLKFYERVAETPHGVEFAHMTVDASAELQATPL